MLLDREYLINSANQLGITIDKTQSTINIYNQIMDTISNE